MVKFALFPARPVDSRSRARKTILAGPYHNLIPYAQRSKKGNLGVLKKVKERIAVSGIPSHSYGTSLAIWDHTVLPATRHK